MSVAVPPLELEAAIQSACHIFNVPVDILTGVWIIESGASFPDTAVNSIGYGGLFGTTDYNGSPQNQAYYAASILEHLYLRYGTWTLALYHYSGGGYNHVPGQITEDFDMAQFDQWVNVPKDASGNYATTWGALEEQRSQEIAAMTKDLDEIKTLLTTVPDVRVFVVTVEGEAPVTESTTFENAVKLAESLKTSTPGAAVVTVTTTI